MDCADRECRRFSRALHRQGKLNRIAQRLPGAGLGVADPEEQFGSHPGDGCRAGFGLLRFPARLPATKGVFEGRYRDGGFAGERRNGLSIRSHHEIQLFRGNTGGRERSSLHMKAQQTSFRTPDGRKYWCKCDAKVAKTRATGHDSTPPQCEIAQERVVEKRLVPAHSSHRISKRGGPAK